VGLPSRTWLQAILHRKDLVDKCAHGRAKDAIPSGRHCGD